MSALEKARRSWGADAPDWVMALAEECAATSQARAARRIGVSATVVNTVLGKRYTGRMDNVERKVRNILLAATVLCPYFGRAIPRKDCDLHRARKSAPTHSPQAFALWRACQTCSENTKEA